MVANREFRGVAVWGLPGEHHLLEWHGTAPNQKIFRLFPVFDSLEKAEEFLERSFSQGGDRDLGSEAETDRLGSVRKIEPGDIRPEADVLLNPTDSLMKWSVLLGGESPHEGYPNKPPSW